MIVDPVIRILTEIGEQTYKRVGIFKPLARYVFTSEQERCRRLGLSGSKHMTSSRIFFRKFLEVNVQIDLPYNTNYMWAITEIKSCITYEELAELFVKSLEGLCYSSMFSGRRPQIQEMYKFLIYPQFDFSQFTKKTGVKVHTMIQENKHLPGRFEELMERFRCIGV